MGKLKNEENKIIYNNIECDLSAAMRRVRFAKPGKWFLGL